MRPLLANMFPIPQSYFVPDRLRITYRSRLESAGLWNSPADAPQENDLRRITMTRLGIAEQLYDEAQGRERVLEKARRTLDILSRLLGEKQYVHHEMFVVIFQTAMEVRLISILQTNCTRCTYCGSHSSSYRPASS